MRGVLIGALCALMLGAAGCGSSGHASGPQLTKAQYQAKLTQIGKEAGKAQSAISKAAESAKSVSDVQAAVRRYADAGDHFASELEALNPPSDAAAANAALARGEHDNADETRAILGKLSAFKTAHAALAYLGTLKPRKGGQEIDAALAKLRDLGYSTGA